MSFQDNVALYGMSEQAICAIFLDEMRSYRAVLVHLEAAWKAHPEWSKVSDRDTDLAMFENLWAGIATEGLGVPRDWGFVERHFTRFDSEMRERIRDTLRRHPDLSESLRKDAIQRLELRGLRPNAINTSVAIDTVARARSEAARRVREGTDYGDLAKLTSLANVAAPSARTTHSSAPPQRPDIEVLSLLASDHFKTDERTYANMTPTEFVEVFIAQKFGGLDHRSGVKRQTRKVKESTYRDLRWASLLLEKSLPAGTPLSQVTPQQLQALDSWFDRLPIMVGKSPRDREAQTTLKDIVERAEERVANGEIDACDIGLSATTTNKHWHNLVRIQGALCALVPGITPFNVNRYITPDIRDARESRDQLTNVQGRAIFNLPPWTGCANINDRLSGGSSIFHDGLYFVPLIVWYTGARREEICKLQLDDIFTEHEIPHIYIRDTKTGGVKTINSIRKIPLHSELIRLGFIDYACKMRECGEELLFPELYPAPGTKRAIGDVFYKIWWIYLRPLIPDLKRGQAMHSARHSASDALKQAGFTLEGRNDLFGQSQSGLGEGASRYSGKLQLENLLNLVETIPNVTAHLPDVSEIALLPADMRVARPSRKR